MRSACTNTKTGRMGSRGARLLNLVRVGRQIPFTPVAKLNNSQAAAASLRPSSLTASFSSNALAGRNIFQLKAAAEAVQETAAPTEPIALPTSDESEKLLRIRHSVSDSTPHGCLHHATCTDS